MFTIFFILLLALSTFQQCSNLTIQAIYPCTISFTLDSSTCKFSSCFTQSPGNSQNSTNFTTCYLSCCPSFLVPSEQTRDIFAPCYEKFSSTPSLVPIIGILLGLTLLSLYVILPCCKNHHCPLYKLRMCFVDTLFSSDKPDLPQILNRIQQQGQYLRSNQNLITSQKMLPGSDRVCLLCHFSKASCELQCGHSFHIYCFNLQKKDKPSCFTCRSTDIFPIKQFCKQCYQTYELRNSLTQAVHKYTCLTCLMQ